MAKALYQGFVSKALYQKLISRLDKATQKKEKSLKSRKKELRDTPAPTVSSPKEATTKSHNILYREPVQTHECSISISVRQCEPCLADSVGPIPGVFCPL